MNTAYGWAFARPVRKLYYNIAITAVSAAVAFLVGGIEIAGLLSTELHLHGRLADAVASVNLNTAGYLMVSLFLAVWALAVLVCASRGWRPAGSRRPPTRRKPMGPLPTRSLE
jgi:high-affinity nickel-transport protein